MDPRYMVALTPHGHWSFNPPWLSIRVSLTTPMEIGLNGGQAKLKLPQQNKEGGGHVAKGTPGTPSLEQSTLHSLTRALKWTHAKLQLTIRSPVL